MTQAAIRWRRELGKAEWVLQRRQEAVEVAQYRLQERWEAMGSIRRGMFRLGVDDQDHKRWRDELARAQRGADRAGTRVKAAADRLETIEAERERLRREQAAQAYWRQTMAQGERERLSERVEQRQHERQTRRLRL